MKLSKIYHKKQNLSIEKRKKFSKNEEGKIGDSDSRGWVPKG